MKRFNPLFLALVPLLSSMPSLGGTDDAQVVLQSQDGKTFKIDKKVAEQSEMLEARFRQDGIEKPVEFKNIEGKTLTSIIDILNGVSGKQAYKEKVVFLREILPKNSTEVSLILRAVAYLQLKEPLVANTVADVFGEQIFDSDLKWLGFQFEGLMKEKRPQEYKRYLGSTFNDIPEIFEKRIIERKLRSIDRIFIDTTPDRRLKAVESMNDTDNPLVVAQVIAYIAKYEVPSAKTLPEPLRTVLKDWLGDDFASKIHFGPWPTEWATWPGHCPLPGDAAYNMYSDTTPNDRYVNNGDGTVTDICTKLTWEQTPSMPPAPLQESQNHCERLDKAKISDWRAPTRIELQSIVNYSATTPALNAVFGERNAKYWSSTTAVGYENKAWTVDFDGGWVLALSRTEKHRIRCVRGERGGVMAAGAKNHYTYGTASHTVTDNFTGAIWQRGVVDQGKNHVTLDYCTKLEQEGRGWKLPTVKVLSTLVDVGLDAPRIDREAFPATPEQLFWSRSPRVDIPRAVWLVDFERGFVSFNHAETNYPARCVR